MKVDNKMISVFAKGSFLYIRYTFWITLLDLILDNFHLSYSKLHFFKKVLKVREKQYLFF